MGVRWRSVRRLCSSCWRRRAAGAGNRQGRTDVWVSGGGRDRLACDGSRRGASRVHVQPGLERQGRHGRLVRQRSLELGARRRRQRALLHQQVGEPADVHQPGVRAIRGPTRRRTRPGCFRWCELAVHELRRSSWRVVRRRVRFSRRFSAFGEVGVVYTNVSSEASPGLPLRFTSHGLGTRTGAGFVLYF